MTFTNGGMRFHLSNFRLSQSLLITPVVADVTVKLRSVLPESLHDSFTRAQLRSIWSPSYEDVEQRERDIDHMIIMNKLNGGEDVLPKTISYLKDR